MSRALLALVVILACAAVVSANTCGGNCPSNNCPSCPCGTSVSRIDISAQCSAFGGWNQAACRCIVTKESGGSINAAQYNSHSGGSFDVGVWQVNSFNWNACSGGHAPCNVQVNRGCAIDVWRWGGGTFKFWSTCGACGVCASKFQDQLTGQEESGISAEWDGTWPSWYDASKPFPSWAVNSSDPRIAESLNYKMPAQVPQPSIVLTEQ